MKPFLLASVLVTAFAASPVLAQSTTQASPTSAEKQFINHLAHDGQGEVVLGRLAEQKAASPDVRALAQRLTADHTQANRQLAEVAQQMGVTPAKGIGKKDQALRARLEKLNGAEFDRAYVEAQVKDHQKDIPYVRSHEAQLQNPQLKSFAQQTVPILQQHLKLAEQTSQHLTESGSSTPPASGTAR